MMGGVLMIVSLTQPLLGVGECRQLAVISLAFAI